MNVLHQSDLPKVNDGSYTREEIFFMTNLVPQANLQWDEESETSTQTDGKRHPDYSAMWNSLSVQPSQSQIAEAASPAPNRPKISNHPNRKNWNLEILGLKLPAGEDNGPESPGDEVYVLLKGSELDFDALYEILGLIIHPYDYGEISGLDRIKFSTSHPQVDIRIFSSFISVYSVDLILELVYF